MIPRALLALTFLCLLFPASCWAVDFFFLPDTARGDVGDTVIFSGYIGPSDSMRAFTVYLGYDTTRIRLAMPPTPGDLIAGREGLQFYYYDHTWVNPDRLDIGAAVYSTDYWAGPGELFEVRFLLLRCGDEPVVAPYFPRFVAPDGSTMPWTFNPAAVLICDRVPESPSYLTIHSSPPQMVTLRWSPVTHDTLGRPLVLPVYYEVVRQQILPTEEPPATIATVSDTFFVDSTGSTSECLYRIFAQTDE